MDERARVQQVEGGGDGEQRGVVIGPAACGDVQFQQSFLRADEWLGDQPLWSSLVQTHQMLRAGLHHLPHP